jgi:hypothetical protein
MLTRSEGRGASAADNTPLASEPQDASKNARRGQINCDNIAPPCVIGNSMLQA